MEASLMILRPYPLGSNPGSFWGTNVSIRIPCCAYASMYIAKYLERIVLIYSNVKSLINKYCKYTLHTSLCSRTWTFLRSKWIYFDCNQVGAVCCCCLISTKRSIFMFMTKQLILTKEFILVLPPCWWFDVFIQPGADQGTAITFGQKMGIFDHLNSNFYGIKYGASEWLRKIRIGHVTLDFKSIWVILRCSRQLSLVEGRCSEWF